MSVLRLIFFGIMTPWLGCSMFSAESDDAYGHYQRGPIREPSGLVASRINKGVFWTHNDSGDQPRIFAVTARGDLLGEFEVQGADAKDWEAITTDHQGRLYVADFGNNLNRRRDLVVYRLPEPAVPRHRGLVSGTVKVDAAIRFFYPEQKAFPDRRAKNFDAEAIFWVPRPKQGRLFLLTKHRSDQKTALYVLPSAGPRRARAARWVGAFDVGGDPELYGGQVTGAALTPDGRYLAVLTYHALFVFSQPAKGDNYLAHFKNRIDFEQSVTQQVEGVAWDGSAVLFSNEQGAIFRVSSPLKAYPGRFPRPTTRPTPGGASGPP